jgi:hypothetical protein
MNEHEQQAAAQEAPRMKIDRRVISRRKESELDDAVRELEKVGWEVLEGVEATPFQPNPSDPPWPTVIMTRPVDHQNAHIERLGDLVKARNQLGELTVHHAELTAVYRILEDNSRDVAAALGVPMDPQETFQLRLVAGAIQAASRIKRLSENLDLVLSARVGLPVDIQRGPTDEVRNLPAVREIIARRVKEAAEEAAAGGERDGLGPEPEDDEEEGGA